MDDLGEIRASFIWEEYCQRSILNAWGMELTIWASKAYAKPAIGSGLLWTLTVPWRWDRDDNRAQVSSEQEQLVAPVSRLGDYLVEGLENP